MATFVSNFVEKESVRVNHEEDRYGPEGKVRVLHPSLSMSDSSDDDKILSRGDMRRGSRWSKRRKEHSYSSRILDKDDSRSRTSGDKSKEWNEQSSESSEAYSMQKSNAPGLKFLRPMQGSSAKAVD